MVLNEMVGSTPKDLAEDDDMITIAGDRITVGELKWRITEEVKRRNITPQTVFVASVLREIRDREMGVTGAEFTQVKDWVSERMLGRMIKRDKPFHLTRRYLSDLDYLLAIKVPGVKTRYAISDKGVEFVNHVFSHAAFDPLHDDGLAPMRPKTPEEEGLRRVDSEPMPTYDENQS
jgi:hypothetical protein